MKSQERQQFWQQHVDAWQASDLSGAAFCKQHDLNYAQFNYWRRKFQPDAEHALVFQKKGDLNLEKALNFAPKMKFLGLFLNKLIPIASKVKRLFK